MFNKKKKSTCSTENKTIDTFTVPFVRTDTKTKNEMIQAQRRSWDINVLIVILAHIRQGFRKTCDGVIAWIRNSTRKSPSVRDECSEHFHPNQPETQRYENRNLP